MSIVYLFSHEVYYFVMLKFKKCHFMTQLLYQKSRIYFFENKYGIL